MDEEVIEVVMLPGGEKSTVTSHHHLPPIHPHNHPFFHHQQQQLHQQQQNQLTNGSTGAESTGDQQQQQQLRGSKDSGGGNKHFCYQLTHFNVFNLFRQMKSLKKNKRRESWDSIQDSEFEEMDGPHIHFRPEALDTLCQLTKFSKRELQMMYRSFKQEAPSGVVREDAFKHIFSQFFVKGADCGQYAHFVFNTFDPEHNGLVTFTDFVIGLSVLSRGTIQDKLRWTFSLYDVNGDGAICRNDLSRIIISIYDLMGKSVDPPVDESTYKEHIDRVFEKLDLNNEGVITWENFLQACTQDETIMMSLDVFNTSL